MRFRDVLIAFCIPLILIIALYYSVQGPRVYHPPNAQKRMKSGQSLTIVFFGDSITSGVGSGKNYVYQFRMALKSTTAFDRTIIVNAGVPGNTSSDGLARLDSDVLSHKPDLVYIEFGGNDLLQKVPLSTFENNLREMVNKLRATGGTETILMTLPVFDIPFSKKSVEQFNTVIRKVAKDTNVGCLDIYNSMKKEIGWTGSASDYMQPDHIHPNDKGNQLIFQNIWNTLQS